MSTALLGVALLVGLCAWGFLLAGVLSFYEADEFPIRGLGWILVFADLFLSLGFFTMLFFIARHWKQKPEARGLLYTGIICLMAALGLGLIYWKIR